MIEKNISVFIVDDHIIFAEGVANLLRGAPGIHVAGYAHSGIDALTFLKSNNVNVVLSDIEMKGMNGIELSAKIKEQFPDTYVIALSMIDKKEVIRELLDTGAEGYLLKDIEKKELLKAITEVVSGKYYYSGTIAALVMQSLTEKDLLTRREKEIIRLIVLEKTNAEIASTLFISEHTVESHRKNIFRKTGSRNIVGLIKYAYESKLI
jgi:two-component system nitrate/nitrite response regulator NarL